MTKQAKGLSPTKTTTHSKRPAFVAKTGNIFGNNRLDVPQCYIDEAAKKNLEIRWLSSKDLRENHGAHKNHYAAYKFESNPSDGIMSDERFAYGNDPEGIVRRGDLVLGARPIEIGDQHRAHLAEKRQMYNRFSETNSKNFADFVKETGRGAMKVEDRDD